MTANRIHLRNVNLYYQSEAFKERSLKRLVFQLLSSQSSQNRIHDVHALKSISADILAGERVALLGNNGAGKTTFLKMLAGLYPISSGERLVEGNIRSLFDLNLGFEPEASGRENILYRSLLMGLTPQFIREIEAEIVDFADLGEFIDYPIKTYSAGMAVRLAFAISTAVGSDVLLIDEVIGAGDENFMVKANKRILSLIERSKILVLASHDIESLTAFCERGLVFHHGELVYDGKLAQSIQEYHRISDLR